jgi:hypothetical protein
MLIISDAKLANAIHFCRVQLHEAIKKGNHRSRIQFSYCNNRKEF